MKSDALIAEEQTEADGEADAGRRPLRPLKVRKREEVDEIVKFSLDSLSILLHVAEEFPRDEMADQFVMSGVAELSKRVIERFTVLQKAEKSGRVK